MGKYSFKEIEAKWQKIWKENQTFKCLEDENYPKEKRCYVLDMFPYPSGEGLHVGHPEGYTATDIYSRFLRMSGYNVLHPIGFDSFGLPAENYAIKTGTHPLITTEKNIKNFERQIESLGFSYDWSRKISTCEPSYYKWTQYLFLKLYEKGLAYEKEAAINWCPSCMTGLANEEVKDGKCERCSSNIERKNIRQWFLKITEYADKLLEDLDELDWPTSIKEMQRNWIGRSVGCEVEFGVKLYDGSCIDEKIKIFTTRVDTIYGVTYIVLSPEHPLLDSIVSTEEKEKIEEYVKLAKNKSDLERTDLAKDKTGVFTGSYAIHPLTKQLLPIWISDYVLSSYGTGAVMAVPFHDERDWAFASKFSLPKKRVVIKNDEDNSSLKDDCFTEEGKSINSEDASGLCTKEAKVFIAKKIEEMGCGKQTVYYKMRDWIFSRQRYWGEPIPIIHCPKCGCVPLKLEDLPLTLPNVDAYKPSNTGDGPLSVIEEWVNTMCPKCGGKAKRETNTMPQWAGSCWYYLRYTDPHNYECFANKEKTDYWMPVNLYVGGAEHAVLHLLYARFWHRVFYDLGLVKDREPFKKLVNQGLITSFAYMRKNKSLVPTDEVKESDGKFFDKASEEELTQVIAKMSKSLKNVVNPDDIIGEYGADTFRMYEMFLGPLEMSKPWNIKGILGLYRFLEKVWNLLDKPIKELKENDISNEINKKITYLLHKTIKKVTLDTQSLNFNTAISQMMIFVNEFSKLKEIPCYAIKTFLKLLCPYAPHITEEMWERLGEKALLCNTAWPIFIEEYCQDENKTVMISINGKVKGSLSVASGTEKDEIIKLAFENECIKRLSINKENVKKIIVVPDKIINIVV
ncbi:MAG: leucine--tRNA ligase [Treponema sp.]